VKTFFYEGVSELIGCKIISDEIRVFILLVSCI